MIVLASGHCDMSLSSSSSCWGRLGVCALLREAPLSSIAANLGLGKAVAGKSCPLWLMYVIAFIITCLRLLFLVAFSIQLSLPSRIAARWKLIERLWEVLVAGFCMALSLSARCFNHRGYLSQKLGARIVLYI